MQKRIPKRVQDFERKVAFNFSVNLSSIVIRHHSDLATRIKAAFSGKLFLNLSIISKKHATRLYKTKYLTILNYIQGAPVYAQQNMRGPPSLDMKSRPEEVRAWLQYKGFSKG